MSDWYPVEETPTCELRWSYEQGLYAPPILQQLWKIRDDKTRTEVWREIPISIRSEMTAHDE